MQVEVGTENCPGGRRASRFEQRELRDGFWPAEGSDSQPIDIQKTSRDCVTQGQPSAPLRLPFYLERMPRAFWPMRSPYFLASALSSSVMSSKEALGVSSLQ